MKINDDIESPLLLKISFSKLIEHYEDQLRSDDEFIVSKAQRIVALKEKYPILCDGFEDTELLETYRKEIKVILQESFSDILTKNEIKTASVPFHDLFFNESERFRSILKEAGADYEPTIRNMPEKYRYIIACTIILNRYYGYNLDFKRPFFYEIPDKNGFKRTYRILYNADFIEIIPTDKAKGITQKDVDELLDNFGNLEMWKEKFPQSSYILKGFVISNIFDVTADTSISDIKSELLSHTHTGPQQATDDGLENFERIFRVLFGVKDLRVGVTNYSDDGTLEHVMKPGSKMISHLLNNKEAGTCKTILCAGSNKKLIETHEYFAISDVDKYYEMSGGIAPYSQLKEQGIKSAILAPIAAGDQLLGILELVSTESKVLNSINANKLIDVLPYIVSSVQRAKAEEENLIESVIQKEYTAIHSSVAWRFEQEAKDYLIAMARGQEGMLHEIAFKNVYPLYGQIDIKGSSESRNMATQKDLKLQLEMVIRIIEAAVAKKDLPIYKVFQLRLENHLLQISEVLQVDSEQTIANFLASDVHPLLQHIASESLQLEELVKKYNETIDEKIGIMYHHRKQYDETITLINKNMADILDKKQEEAQYMYPHFFERFKTDGVEHNMYIGESITKKEDFNEIYLYNLRLWQLQVMCEMENAYYKLKKGFPVSLEVASLILVFNNPLSIRFRMDEKRFDVDGTYNARYEVVKKRVDKAYIKGTQERVTVEGKIAIVYSQKSDEKEYLRYIKFLQSRNYLGKEIEIVELEDLQGVTGLKALRVTILYKTDKKGFYTYKDLMKELV